MGALQLGRLMSAGRRVYGRKRRSLWLIGRPGLLETAALKLFDKQLVFSL
ncbi:hypothetical protein [Novosphingobium sp.]